MPRRLLSRVCRFACETERKVNGPAEAGHYVRYAAYAAIQLYALIAIILVSTPRLAWAQSGPAAVTARETRAQEAQPAAEKSTPEQAGETEEHEEGLLPVVARLVNFALLVGTLIYFLRAPAAAYLSERGTQIRSDLVNAADMKQTAAAQLEEIDRKMKALPGELEALRAQGAQEIAAEEARIRAAAATERDRLLEQARRDIDHLVKVAERELVSHAADLAVGVAAERIKQTITDDDQRRLADRYVQQLKR